jgi:hypothetical protein
MFFARFAAVAATTLFFAGAASSLCLAAPRSSLPAEEYTLPYTGSMPLCDDPFVLNSVSSAFGWREWEFWHSGLQLSEFRQVRETGSRSNGIEYIPRRYCTARATFSDGHERVVKYNVIEDGGPFGYNFGVDWCVVGLDRNRAFAPGCQAATP